MSVPLFDQPQAWVDPPSGQSGGMRPHGLNPTPLADAEPPLAVDDDVAVASLETPVGRLGVVVSPVGVSAVGWRDPTELTGGRPIIRDQKRLSSVIEQLTAYFHGELRQFTVELDLRRATATQRLVLRTLHDTVAYGSSVTYGQLAHRSRTGVPARGIGSMLAANPIPIVVAVPPGTGRNRARRIQRGANGRRPSHQAVVVDLGRSAPAPARLVGTRMITSR